MGIKSILSLFREDDWTTSLVAMLDEMLEQSSAMFAYTMDVLLAGAPDVDPMGRVFAPDKRINELVRQIRRRVATRLAVGGRRGEVPTALIFMNAVKDAERIGDYVKNIHEVGDLMPARPDRALYVQWLGQRTVLLKDLMLRTRQAFANSDDAGADQVIAETRRLGQECESAIADICGSQLATRDAVCLVLTLRFFKRVSSHLSNIATTIVMPVDLLDFHEEREAR